MKRRLSFLLVVAVALIFAFGAKPQPAAAVPSSATSDCTSVTVMGTEFAGQPVFGSAFRLTPFLFLGSGNMIMPFSGAYTLTFPITQQPPGTAMQIIVTDAAGFPTSFIITCGSASTSGAVTVFNPGDGRVDPQAGDRLAIWCNTSGDAPNLLIYGVASDSKGVFLATINFADLLKAGNPRYAELKAKLAKLLKSGNPDPVELDNLLAEARREAGLKVLFKKVGGNGTLIVIVDDQNNFTVSWTGGPYNANGQGVWAKSFKCNFSR